MSLSSQSNEVLLRKELINRKLLIQAVEKLQSKLTKTDFYGNLKITFSEGKIRLSEVTETTKYD